MRAFANDAEGVFGTIVAKMIGTHVRRIELIVCPTQADRVTQSPREDALLRTVRVHLQHGCAHVLTLLRSPWGNSGDIVTVEEVQKVHAESVNQ